jgi:hypothetical protein
MTSAIITAIAATNNAAVIIDRDGDVALLARHYDEDGHQVARHRPDPCDFLPVARWESMTAEQVAAAVC